MREPALRGIPTSSRIQFESGNFLRQWIVPVARRSVTPATVRISDAKLTDTKAQKDKRRRGEGVSFTAPVVITEKDSADQFTPVLAFENEDGTNAIGFRLPRLSSSTLYTLPASDGLSNQQLTTNGQGQLFWTDSQSAALGSSYEIFQDSGTPVTQRAVVNFSNGLAAFDNLSQQRTEVRPVYGATAGTITAGDDPRLFDARVPLPHAASHSSDGGDELTPESIGALRSADATVTSNSETSPALTVQGSNPPGNSIQEWRNENGFLVGLVTPEGSAFFREMGLATKIGGTVTSQFFQVNGFNRFAFSAFETALNISRYDDNGNFKDTAFQILRNGGIVVNTPLNMNGYYIALAQSTAPPLPAAGAVHLFLDQAGGGLSVLRSDGSVVSLESSGAGQVPQFADAEVPNGIVDGQNAQFTLSVAPSAPNSLLLTRNGLVLAVGADFTLTGNTITLQPGEAPQVGDLLRAWYRF